MVWAYICVIAEDLRDTWVRWTHDMTMEEVVDQIREFELEPVGTVCRDEETGWPRLQFRSAVYPERSAYLQFVERDRYRGWRADLLLDGVPLSSHSMWFGQRNRRDIYSAWDRIEGFLGSALAGPPSQPQG